MKFKENNCIIYTKNEYYKESDNGLWFYTKDNLLYYKGYLVHRKNGPAEKFNTGSKCWYKNGKIHREDGPAYEWSDGEKWWYKDGKRHREDGPAIEWFDGDKDYFLNDIRYSEDEYWKIINIKKKNKILNKICKI